MNTRTRNPYKKIERVEHGPFGTDIRLDDTGVFHCQCGALGTSGTLPEVRTWARNKLRELCNIRWHPIMRVNFDAEDMRVNNLRNASNINCYIERCWIAWAGTKWIECPWVVDRAGTFMCIGPANSEREQDKMPAGELMAQRIARSKDFYDGPDSDVITWPLVSKEQRERVYYVPYTEEHWQTMLGLLERIRELRASINRLLRSGDGWRTLAKIAESKLLSPPEK